MAKLIPVLFLASALAVTGCSSKKSPSNSQQNSNSGKSQPTVQTPPKQTVLSEKPVVQQVDDLISIGESILFRDHSVVLANRLFEAALKRDERNERAIFYVALTRPSIEIIKGFSRLMKTDNKKISYLAREIALGQNSLAPFFFNAFREIDPSKNNLKGLIDQEDAQNMIRDSIIPTFIHSAEMLSGLKGDLTINFTDRNSYLASEMTSVEASYVIGGEYEHLVTFEMGELRSTVCRFNEASLNCDLYETSREQIVSAHDIDMFRTSLLALANYGRLITAYQLTGHLKVAEALRTEQRQQLEATGDKRLVPSQIKDILSRFPKYGTLHEKQELDLLLKDSQAIARQLIAWNEMQYQICSKMGGHISESILKSICVSDNGAKDVSAALDLLMGKKEINVSTTSEPLMVQIDLRRFLSNPPRDLKPLIPSGRCVDDFGVNGCYSDPTFAGLFPEGDIIDLVDKKEANLGFNSGLDAFNEVGSWIEILLSKIAR